MSQGDSTLLLKPVLLIVSVAVMAVVVTLAVNGLLAFTGNDYMSGQPAAESGGGGGGILDLPGEWSGYEWYSEDLREDGMKYKNETAGNKVNFQPKKMNNSTLPENENRRELVKYGRRLFANTSKLMPGYTGGTRMSCANCHGGGSLPTTTGMVGQDIDMIPLVGTASGYPEWTGRTQRMRDMRQRIMGCFLRSMDAANAEKGVPAYDSREIQAMETYMVWLNKGTPSQKVPYWRHIEKPEGNEKKPVPEVNPVRGAKLYLENCASCHGKDGQGKKGQYPPLWGPNSFNDGAGMGRLYTSAGFIREAMPYGTAHSFKDWDDVQDVAGFMNAHKRPHLPRQPKDWEEAGVKKEGIYYKRAQEHWGYDMNPMTKKLLIAGIPIGSQPINKSVIPEDYSKYDDPMKNTSVEGSWKTTWMNKSNTYANWKYAEDSGSSNNSTQTNSSASLTVRGAVTDAMANGDSTAKARENQAS
ncbi:c-type cytochrome [Halorussus halophilus]|uniref:c-type cytochrome n=1 Tax=Halorussus halophilus TaxID=2650975 RepID=UPI001CE403EE|nr:c-type cytochrome [Halorussus halophilus]